MLTFTKTLGAEKLLFGLEQDAGIGTRASPDAVPLPHAQGKTGPAAGAHQIRFGVPLPAQYAIDYTRSIHFRIRN